ncbi:peptidoglycan-binding domain-containing protein [Streptomyces sp. PR69]|uniref:peptidoglycan-binding domain-containing protein n=1 Tax=Streptomyces sp. PR69 TaxID=2984950 RepID=UPI00226501E1|nr:peptidoglycan-binding domain-containing protein [Streptomyces sp. PR69]
MRISRRFAASAAVIASLMAGSTALSAGSASAAPAPASTKAAPAGDSAIQAWYCGYDNRRTPPTIRQGSQGNTVREAQCLLVARGFGVGASGIDGAFGPATYRAARDFQSWCGIGVDGIIGPVTWDRLRNGC